MQSVFLSSALCLLSQVASCTCGASTADLPRSRGILITFICFYLWLIMGSFGVQVDFSLFTNPAVPIGVLLVILVGLLAGQMTYKWKQDIILTSVVTVVLAFLSIWIGTLPFAKNIMSVILGTANGATSPTLFLQVTQAKLVGSLLVVIIRYLGSVLPIWRWAQPINCVAFWIVFVGILGLLIWRPGMGDFPAYTKWTIGVGPLWPMLFVTTACGAISGWHSLVSSSGTARQLEKEKRGFLTGSRACSTAWRAMTWRAMP